MPCFIFGVDGFLGSNLAKFLIAQGREVIGTALSRKNFTSLDALGVKCRVEYGDVTDKNFVARVINAYEARDIFHLAAVSIVRVAEANPVRAIETNAIGALNVLEAARNAKGVNSVVVASSDKAYGDYGGRFYQENMPLNPTGTYEVSKACADLITQLYGRHYGLRAIVTRCANLYGPGDMNFSRLIPNSCRKALNGESPVIHAGVWQNLREWIYVEDACNAYSVLASKGEPGAYNVGTGELRLTGDIAQQISRLTGAPVPQVVNKDVDFYEIPQQCLDSWKIHNTGWKSSVTFDDGIAKTIEWYKHYLGSI